MMDNARGIWHSILAEPLGRSSLAMEGYTTKKVTALISLAGSQVGEMRDVCAFFSVDDEYRVLLPFIEDGLGCNCKAVRIDRT
jgi:hypothetical protein